MGRRLIIVGSGATAEKLAEVGGGLGYDELRLTSDLPDDLAGEDHLVIAEEDPDQGRRILLRAAQAPVVPMYVGYAAPQREGWKALVSLAAARVPKARIDAVSAPAGVDVGAETPLEVAISVAAELVAVRRGRARPSAGLAIRASRSRVALPRPKRLIGAFARPRPEDDGEDDDEGGGRN